MKHRTAVRAVAVAVAPVLSAALAATAAQAATGPAASSGSTSTIYNPATHSCAEVPGGTTDINTNVVSAPCTGTADQTFSFQPVAGAPAGTYNIVNQASGLCIFQYRFGVRQNNCLASSPENTAYEWNLQPVSAAQKKYVLEPTNQAASSLPRVLQAIPASSGNPTPPLTLAFYSAGTAQQQFTLAGLG